jgi:hypothetical protein
VTAHSVYISWLDFADPRDHDQPAKKGVSVTHLLVRTRRSFAWDRDVSNRPGNKRKRVAQLSRSQSAGRWHCAAGLLLVAVVATALGLETSGFGVLVDAGAQGPSGSRSAASAMARAAGETSPAFLTIVLGRALYSNCASCQFSP